MFYFLCFAASDLLALRTDEEWEEVRQRICDLPQDEALVAELSKVRPAAPPSTSVWLDVTARWFVVWWWKFACMPARREAWLLKMTQRHSAVVFSQEQPIIAAHCFKEGMKLEAVDPAAPISIRPATVTKVTEFLIKSVSSLMQWLSYLLFTLPSVILSVHYMVIFLSRSCRSSI